MWIGVGGYDITWSVVDTGNRAREQTDQPVTLVAEWYTGNSAVGYINTGAVIKLTQKLTLYTSCPIGNSGLSAVPMGVGLQL